MTTDGSSSSTSTSKVNVGGKYINNNSTNDTAIVSPSLLPPTTVDGDGDEQSTTSLPSAQSSLMMMSGGSGICYRLRSNWKVLVLGQILSLLLACAGATQATLHLNCGLSAPTFTMSLVYLGLTLTHLPILIWRRFFGRQQQLRGGERGRGGGGQERLPTHDTNDNDGVLIADDEDKNNEEEHNGTNIDNNVNNLPFLNRSFLWYLLLAFFDVEANAVTMLAFRYTTLTSVTIFDALAIPASMIISKCFFQYRRYRTLHYFGVAICMMGIVLNVLQDYESDTTSSSGSDSTNFTDDNEETLSISTEQQYYPHKIKGDICAIIGGLLYGLNDVLTEVTVTSGDTTEYLGMIGLFGFCISFVQSLVLEQDDIRKFFGNKESDNGEDDIDSDSSVTMCSLPIGFLLLFSFVGVTMLSYIGASRFLIISEAAFFNLSLLTGDLWSVVFSVVAERIVPQPLFFAALASVLSGVVLYEMAPSPAPEKGIKYEENEDYTNDGIIMLSRHENDDSTSNSSFNIINSPEDDNDE